MWQYNYYNNELKHHGIIGQKWGIRRFQNSDGTLTAEGRRRYDSESDSIKKKLYDESVNRSLDEMNAPLWVRERENINKSGKTYYDAAKNDRYVLDILSEKWSKQDHTDHDRTYRKKTSGDIFNSLFEDIDDSYYDIGSSYAESYLDYKLSDLWD